MRTIRLENTNIRINIPITYDEMVQETKRLNGKIQIQDFAIDKLKEIIQEKEQERQQLDKQIQQLDKQIQENKN